MTHRWSPSDVSWLRDAWLRGMLFKVMRRHLNRSEDSIRAKAQRLGLPRRKNGGRRYMIQVRFHKEIYDKIMLKATLRGTTGAGYIRSLVLRDL